jgi:hypothetical protein
MNSTSYPDGLADAEEARDCDHAAGTGLFDRDMFREFIDLLGPDQARFWIDEFRNGLEEEFARPGEPAQVHAMSRANIHRICARAGLIGFRGLHEACLGFLEAGAEQEDADTAYRHLLVQAERAFPELERQSALIS